MSNYNAVVKVHQNKVNQILTRIHTALYPEFLTGKIDPTGLEIYKASWDIKSPLAVDFNPSKQALTKLMENVDKNSAQQLSEDEKIVLRKHIEQNSITFSASVPNITLGFSDLGEWSYLEGCSFSAQCAISCDHTGKLSARIVDSQVVLPGAEMEFYQDLINGSVVPMLNDLVNEWLAESFAHPIPAIEGLAVPVVRVEGTNQKGIAVYFSGQEGGPTVVPEQNPLANMEEFIAVDEHLVQAVINEVIPPFRVENKLDLSIGWWPIRFGVVGSYAANFVPPTIRFTQIGGGQLGIEGFAKASGGGRATAHIGLIYPTLGFSIAGQLDFGGVVRILDNGMLAVRLNRLECNIDIKPDLLIWPFDRLIGMMTSVIVEQIASFVTATYLHKDFPIIQVTGTEEIDAGDFKLVVSTTNATLDTLKTDKVFAAIKANIDVNFNAKNTKEAEPLALSQAD